VTALRSLRNQAQVSPKESLTLYVASEVVPTWLAPFASDVKKLANIVQIEPVATKPEQATSCTIEETTFYLVLGKSVDVAQEREQLEKELAYARCFLTGVMKKLSNERFVKSAPPQVVALERKKQADAEAKINALKERLGQLGTVH